MLVSSINHPHEESDPIFTGLACGRLIQAALYLAGKWLAIAHGRAFHDIACLPLNHKVHRQTNE